MTILHYALDAICRVFATSGLASWEGELVMGSRAQEVMPRAH